MKENVKEPQCSANDGHSGIRALWHWGEPALGYSDIEAFGQNGIAALGHSGIVAFGQNGVGFWGHWGRCGFGVYWRCGIWEERLSAVPMNHYKNALKHV